MYLSNTAVKFYGAPLKMYIYTIAKGFADIYTCLKKIDINNNNKSALKNKK